MGLDSAFPEYQASRLSAFPLSIGYLESKDSFPDPVVVNRLRALCLHQLFKVWPVLYLFSPNLPPPMVHQLMDWPCSGRLPRLTHLSAPQPFPTPVSQRGYRRCSLTSIHRYSKNVLGNECGPMNFDERSLFNSSFWDRKSAIVSYALFIFLSQVSEVSQTCGDGTRLLS